MTNDEDFVMRVLVQALRWKVRYEDSNPDVGMGSFPENHLDSILNDCDMGIDGEMKNRVLILHKEYERY